MHPSEKYAQDVLSNNSIACRFVRLACERFLDDLENGHKRDLYFDEDKADAVLNFFDYLKLWKGKLKTTSGSAIDYDFIREQVMQDAEQFQIDSISIDRYFQGWEFSMKLDEQLGGTEKAPKIFACGMGSKSMSVLCLEFEKRLKDKKINHGANPILRWMADNVAVKINPAGTIDKVDKATSQGKVDGIVAMLLALDRLMRKMGTGKSVYEERGLLSL